MNNKIVAVGPDNSAEGLIQQAIVNKVDVGTMERLLAMRNQIKAEQAKEAFDRALAKFQAECPPIRKDKAVNDKFGKLRYKYAPLDTIVAQVKGHLQKNGFSYTTDALVEEGWVTAVCKVTHELGHSEVSNFKVPVDKDSYMSAPQKFAAALTFAKRYAFCNAFGILTGDEDNDANDFDSSPVEDKAVPVVVYDNPETTKNDPAPWKKKAPAEMALASRVKALKQEIKDIADKTVLVPLEGKQAYEDWVFEMTSMDLSTQTEENLKNIINALLETIHGKVKK